MNVEYLNNRNYRNAWVKLTGVNAAQRRWLKETIPAAERYYENGAWFTHSKHLENLYLLGTDAKPAASLCRPDDYAVLHLRPDAPMAIVDAVFRTLSRLHHPDKGGDPEDFKRLSAAYHRIKERNSD